MTTTAFDTLRATRADLRFETSALRAELNAAVIKMILAQVAIAGALFAAIRLF